MIGHEETKKMRCFFFKVCDVELCPMKYKDSKVIYVVIKVRMGCLREGLATLGSRNFGCPHERWFHSHCVPVIFLLLRAVVQVLKSVLIISNTFVHNITVRILISGIYGKD